MGATPSSPTSGFRCDTTSQVDSHDAAAGPDIRRPWRAPTTMGTRLVLLFLLALERYPRAAAAAQPQRVKVDQYLIRHPVIGPWLDRLQIFRRVLQFLVSPPSCAAVHLPGRPSPRGSSSTSRSLRATPVPAPRNLSRLPRHAPARRHFPMGRRPHRPGQLRGWRCCTRQSRPVTEISAEKAIYASSVTSSSTSPARPGVPSPWARSSATGNVIVIADGGPGDLFGLSAPTTPSAPAKSRWHLAVSDVRARQSTSRPNTCRPDKPRHSRPISIPGR